MTAVTQLPVPNEQRVSAVADRLINVLEGIPDNIALAALADTVGCICDMNAEHKDAMLNYVSERSWAYAHAVFIKRAPRPDNVTPLAPVTPGD